MYVIRRNGIRNLAVALLLIMGAPNAFANDKSSQFGLVYGFSVPDANNVGAYKIYGFKGEYFLTQALSVGGYFLLSDTSGQTSNSSNDKFKYSLHGLDTAWHMAGSGGESFVAFRLGVTKLHMNPGGQDLIYSPYHYGFASGYDFFVGASTSLGFEGSYLHVLPGRSSYNNVVYDQPSFNIINFMVSAKFRF